MVADDLAQTAVRLWPGPCDPNSSLAIFENGANPTGDMLLEMVILPTPKASRRPDPERSVRRTQQGHDTAAGHALVRRSPALKTNAVEFHQSGISANPDVAVRRLRDRVGRGFEGALLHRPVGVLILSDPRLGVERRRRSICQRDDNSRGHEHVWDTHD